MPLVRIDVNEGPRQRSDQLRNLSQAIALFADSTGGFSFADNEDSVKLLVPTLVAIKAAEECFYGRAASRRFWYTVSLLMP